MQVDTNSPEYLNALVEGLQKQRNTALDTIAHLASQHVVKDARIAQLQEQMRQLLTSKQQLTPATEPISAAVDRELPPHTEGSESLTDTPAAG